MTDKEALQDWLQARAFEIAVSHELPPLAIKNLELQVVEATAEKLVLQIKTWLAAQRHPSQTHFKRVEFSVPATWWQHLKEALYMRGLVPAFIRWVSPIRYVTLTETVSYEVGPYYLCGHINSKREEDHIKFLRGA